MSVETQNPPYSRKPNVRSLETSLILGMIRRLSVGETLTYEAIEAAVGFNPRAAGKDHYLRSAIDIAAKYDLRDNEPPIHLQNIVGVGYLRLSESDAARHITYVHKKRLTSDNRRFESRLESLDPAKMDPDGQRIHAIGVLSLNLRKTIASKPTERFLKKQVYKQGSGMALSETSDLLKAIAASGFKG